MDFLLLIGLVMVAAFIIGILQSQNQAKRRKAMSRHVRTRVRFVATQELMGDDCETGIAVDEKGRRVCLITSRGETTQTRIISYGDLLSSEIFEDGESVTKTVRSSQVGGALVGAVLLGGVGAVIGGLSGKTRTQGKVKRVDLRIVVNDSKAPAHDINLLATEVKTGGLLHQQAMEQARHWHNVISVLIRQADRKDDNDLQDREGLPAPASADQRMPERLRELAGLRDDGLLTPEEFEAQKARLLNA